MTHTIKFNFIRDFQGITIKKTRKKIADFAYSLRIALTVADSTTAQFCYTYILFMFALSQIVPDFANTVADSATLTILEQF